MVKLRVYVVIWCLGFVLDEKVINKKKKLRAVMLVGRFKTDILMYVVIIADDVQPVLGT